MPGEPYVIGVDVGGTKLSTAVLDRQGSMLARSKEPVRKGTFQSSVEQIASAAARIASDAGISRDRIAGMGICVPGIYSAATGCAWAPNLWGWDEVPLRDALVDRGLEAHIDSDRAAYVLGEQWLGVARGLREVIFLAVGTGIGAGILSGGRLVRGAHDIAGAVGWFALDPRYQEIYRQVGCFEAEAAGPAVARKAGAPEAEAVVKAARSGDPRACEILAETARWLAMGIANLVSVLNPEMIVLGGGLMQAGDLLLERIRTEMLDWAQPIAARKVRIELTSLGEDAGVIGAARLGFPEHHVGR